jgi:Tol biopolymer transport system component
MILRTLLSLILVGSVEAQDRVFNESALASSAEISVATIAVNPDPIPSLAGKLVFHVYSDYSAWDGKLFLLDFAARSLTEISANWNINHTLNAHFSPDGAKMVFMGDEAGGAQDWDIFIWDVGSTEAPTNLTKPNDRREEDPKFSPDGTKIAFKERRWDFTLNDFAYDIKTMNLDGTAGAPVTHNEGVTNPEDSMPFYSQNGQNVIYARGVNENSDIYIVDVHGANNQPLENVSGVQEYYPVARDDSTFLYTRWDTATNRNDQIYLGYFDGTPAVALSFNDVAANDSDPYPAGDQYVFLSSTRAGGQGNYDLYLADINSGAIWSLSEINPNLNSSLHELGASYVSAEGAATVNSTAVPRRFTLSLSQNYPNPFNPSTQIAYQIATPGAVSLVIYNVVGQSVRTLVGARRNAGIYRVEWDGKDDSGQQMSSGVYLYRLLSQQAVQTRRMLLLK